jgi:hypothetical protein
LPPRSFSAYYNLAGSSYRIRGCIVSGMFLKRNRTRVGSHHPTPRLKLTCYIAIIINKELYFAYTPTSVS